MSDFGFVSHQQHSSEFVVSSCEHGKEISGSIKEFVDYINVLYQPHCTFYSFCTELFVMTAQHKSP